ncbi:MAG TPA: hypothetical protein GX525_11915 [Bacilli bacterium]|nr:hypothetical protein [Bacilli bacterium]
MINKKALLYLLIGSLLFYALGLFNFYYFNLSSEILKSANEGIIILGMIGGYYGSFVSNKIQNLFNAKEKAK